MKLYKVLLTVTVGHAYVVAEDEEDAQVRVNDGEALVTVDYEDAANFNDASATLAFETDKQEARDAGLFDEPDNFSLDDVENLKEIFGVEVFDDED